MNFDYSESDEYEADFAANGAIEFEELEDEEPSAEIIQLANRVRAARAWA